LYFAGTAGEELDDRDVVDRRLGVRQSHHRRDPAGGGGLATALDRFHVLGARLAQLHPHFDETRGEAPPGRADALDGGAQTLAAKIVTDRGGALALDEEAAGRVATAFRVDQPSAAKQPPDTAHRAILTRPAGHCRDRARGSRGRPCGLPLPS